MLMIFTNIPKTSKIRGPAQDVPYDLILWYVSKIIYLSLEKDPFSIKSSNLFINLIALIVRTSIVRYHNLQYYKDEMDRSLCSRYTTPPPIWERFSSSFRFVHFGHWNVKI